jgi:hypothetical protein
MALTLGQKQEIFAGLLPQLIVRAYELGFRVRLKELLRAIEQAEYNATHCGRCKKEEAFHAHADHGFKAIGIRDSLHCIGLAIDLVLFRKGKPLWASKHYRELGEYWESLHELCRWGGRFGDGMHFSFAHGGRQ